MYKIVIRRCDLHSKDITTNKIQVRRSTRDKIKCKGIEVQGESTENVRSLKSWNVDGGTAPLLEKGIDGHWSKEKYVSKVDTRYRSIH